MFRMCGKTKSKNLPVFLSRLINSCPGPPLLLSYYVAYPKASSSTATAMVHVLLRPILVLLLVSSSCQAALLGERDFLDLSHDQLVAITSSPDPRRAINLEDPTSHLSKILIPRPRMYHNCHVIYESHSLCSWERQQHVCQGSSRLNSQSPPVAR
jgi:hypothetical protein